MNKHLYIPAILALTLYACGPVYVIHQDPPPPAAEPAPPPPPEQEPDATYQSFYDDLSPYGQWIDDPQYGYVWLPDAGPDFKPYATNGHWVYTDDGWAWASDYPWGWAAFHYGRWFFRDGYGWMWVPGDEWAPAWVSWRDNDEYYGWAPLGPGISFEASYGGGYNPPSHYWNFVPHQYVASPQIRNYYVNETRNVTIINRTTINNTTIINYNTRSVNYGRGPDPDRVGRYTGAPVRPIAIRTANAPGEQVRDGGMTIFRPRISSNPRNTAPNGGSQPRMAPARVRPLNNATPVNTTTYDGEPRRNNNGYNNNNNNSNNNNPDRNTNTGFPNRADNPRENHPPATPANPPAGRTNPSSNQQPYGGRLFNRPTTQPVNQQPVRSSPPAQPAQPAAAPANPPAGQNPRTSVPPPNPVNRQNNRPPVFNRNPPPSQTPAVQQRPAQRPAPPPPPPPRRDADKKDKQ